MFLDMVVDSSTAERIRPEESRAFHSLTFTPILEEEPLGVPELEDPSGGGSELEDNHALECFEDLEPDEVLGTNK